MTDKIKKPKKDTGLSAFPIYLPHAKYQQFKSLCELDRLPMTRVAEAEIDKYIKRKQP